MDKTIKLEWHRVNNARTRCLRITSKEEKAVRSKLTSGRYMTLETRKDGTKFTNRALKDAADRLSALASQYDNTQKQLVEQVPMIFLSFSKPQSPA